MSLDLAVIHEALAAQIRGFVSRDINVAAFPYAGKPAPYVEVWPDPEWIAYGGTMGPNGLADIQVVLRLAVSTANPETAFRQVTDFCSVGTGNPSSIPDAVMADRTLGGSVSDAVVLFARWLTDEESAAQVVEIPVVIRVPKEGAQV